MSSLDCDCSSGLLDLLFSPSGCSRLYDVLVPRPEPSPSLDQRRHEMRSYCSQQGITQDTITQLEMAGLRSLALLALLRPADLACHLPLVPASQRRLLAQCLLTLEPGPPYQVAVAVQRFIKLKNKVWSGTGGSTPHKDVPPSNKFKSSSTNTDCLAPQDEISSALNLVDSVRKILECPVCYLPCPPPRIWQVSHNYF